MSAKGFGHCSITDPSQRTRKDRKMRLEVAEDTLNQYANVDLTSLEGLGSKKMTLFGCPVRTLGFQPPLKQWVEKYNPPLLNPKIFLIIQIGVDPLF